MKKLKNFAKYLAAKLTVVGVTIGTLLGAIISAPFCFIASLISKDGESLGYTIMDKFFDNL